MKKMFLLVALSTVIVSISRPQTNGRLFDQPMRLKNVSFSIHSDALVATTFIEIEFYNPNDKEEEGLFRFHLDPGQAITGFQLELNGKFRDGSIEERWKARSAYSSIVGKRMDPALLQYEYNNNYRLNIFPLPARGTRKVTLTIQQLLTDKTGELIYSFPFDNRDTTGHFEVNIEVTNIDVKAVTRRGLIAGKSFVYDAGKSVLTWKTENLFLAGEISFAIPLVSNRIVYCTTPVNTTNYYALRLAPQVARQFDIHPKRIAVYWDASGSALKRNLKREIGFLQQYVSFYGISELTIIPFTHRILDTVIFYPAKDSNRHWERYLHSLNYDGATQFGCLDFSQVNADMIFLFSDGQNTYGRSMPYTGSSLVYCVNSSMDGNLKHLQDIAGSNGGSCIDLNKLTISDAITESGKVQNWLLNLTSSSGKITCDQILPIQPEKNMILSGVVSGPGDTLTVYYGHGNMISKTERVFGDGHHNCTDSTIEKIRMLQQFSLVDKMYSWEDVLEFGLKERIVTPNTSYIVLEKIEDYIKYNIAPPRDLEEECKKLNYVKKDTRSYRQKLKEQDEFDVVNNVVESYNKKIRQWGKNADTIQLSRREYETHHIAFQDQSSDERNTRELAGKVAGLNISSVSSNSLSEVVVIAYGISSKRSLTGSVSYVTGNQILPGLTIEQNLIGRVAGLEVQSDGSLMNPSSISIRGVASLPNAQPLFVIDGLPVTGNPNNSINVSDIENITVLKDAASTAIYGSRGANGVIIINSKKGRNSGYHNYNPGRYRLKDMDDVDYVQELKSAEMNQKISTYNQLRIEHGNETGFYFDVAQHFFEIGFIQEAKEILLNAGEVSDGDVSVLKAIGYTLESWQCFADAVTVYQQILQINPNDLYTRHDLAWALYQNGNYQEAIRILFESIKLNSYLTGTSASLKAILLNDLNAMIAVKRSEVDISMIPSSLIKPLPVDLRIVVEGNQNRAQNVTIIEPGGANCSATKPVSKRGGFINPDWSDYYNNCVEYEIKEAPKGSYKIEVNYYDYYSYYNYYDHHRYGRIPSFIRIMTFRNYGRADQTITVENVIMDNQYGTIEIGEVKCNR